MKRRHFIRLAAGGASALAGGRHLFSQSRTIREARLRAPREDPDFPYDVDYFGAAERLVFLDHRTAVISILPRPGRRLSLRLACSDRPAFASPPALAAQGVEDSFHFTLFNPTGMPDFRYRVEYKHDEESGGWRSTPWRSVRSPLFDLRTRPLKVIIIGDDHTFDDADAEDSVVREPFLREARLSGDYVNMFLGWLAEEPDWVPGPLNTVWPMRTGFSLASAIRHIRLHESPDFILLLGDTTGIGAGYKWEGLGLKDPQHGLSEGEYDAACRLFWVRMRKMYSALSPTVPIYICQGNHDGESGYDVCAPWARAYRRHYFPQPGALQGASPEENYFTLAWGGGGKGAEAPSFIVLDNESYTLNLPRRPEDWTLGSAQRSWLEGVLRGSESSRKFAFHHHVLGGWPRGSNEGDSSYAYGRGPLFTEEDYAGICPDPSAVEQTALTRLMAENGVRAVILGHDHIHASRRISLPSGAEMHGLCAGSTKPLGEVRWYKGEFWRRFYGRYGWYGTEEAPHSESPDFFGPSGYTRLTITPRRMTVEYIRSFDNHPTTNLPPFLRRGDLVSVIDL